MTLLSTFAFCPAFNVLLVKSSYLGKPRHPVCFCRQPRQPRFSAAGHVGRIKGADQNSTCKTDTVDPSDDREEGVNETSPISFLFSLPLRLTDRRQVRMDGREIGPSASAQPSTCISVHKKHPSCTKQKRPGCAQPKKGQPPTRDAKKGGNRERAECCRDRDHEQEFPRGLTRTTLRVRRRAPTCSALSSGPGWWVGPPSPLILPGKRRSRSRVIADGQPPSYCSAISPCRQWCVGFCFCPPGNPPARHFASVQSKEPDGWGPGRWAGGTVDLVYSLMRFRPRHNLSRATPWQQSRRMPRENTNSIGKED